MLAARLAAIAVVLVTPGLHEVADLLWLKLQILLGLLGRPQPAVTCSIPLPRTLARRRVRALVVGILLGVAIGDAGLVSAASRSCARTCAATSGVPGPCGGPRVQALGGGRGALAGLRRVLGTPLLVEAGVWRAGASGSWFLGPPSPARSVRHPSRTRSTTPAASSRGRSAFASTPDLAALASAAGNTRYTELERDPSLLDDFGRRIGTRNLGSRARALLSTRAGSVRTVASAVVIARQHRRV